MSCCKPEFDAVDKKECKLDQKEKVYQTGCVIEFGNFVRAHAVSLGAAGIILAFIQVSHKIILVVVTFDNVSDKKRLLTRLMCTITNNF